MGRTRGMKTSATLPGSAVLAKPVDEDQAWRGAKLAKFSHPLPTYYANRLRLRQSRGGVCTLYANYLTRSDTEASWSRGLFGAADSCISWISRVSSQNRPWCSRLHRRPRSTSPIIRYPIFTHRTGRSSHNTIFAFPHVSWHPRRRRDPPP